MTEDKLLDPYYYCREHDGSGWSVRGPDGFVIKTSTDKPLDKSVAYIIAKLLSGDLVSALFMLTDYAMLLRDPGLHAHIKRRIRRRVP
jgi:hypothetical protein